MEFLLSMERLLLLSMERLRSMEHLRVFGDLLLCLCRDPLLVEVEKGGAGRVADAMTAVVEATVGDDVRRCAWLCILCDIVCVRCNRKLILANNIEQ